MLTENVCKLLKEQLWYLGTSDGEEPNVVPVGFKDVSEDGKLLVADVFLDATLRNVEKNSRVAVSASNAGTLEGYQVKGKAEYVTSGPVVDAFKKLAEEIFHGKATAKGALIITPDKVIVTTPGPDNKKEL